MPILTPTPQPPADPWAVFERRLAALETKNAKQARQLRKLRADLEAARP